ncbi:hypothetical protein FH972_015276 [Carpinus fangiana]|uniref:J domain-containing protein n=1 Tax=Carpinus fangiana TaxID=176857 RepID=A0A5N6RCU8_9ROSI|nr:hypothetical protein FH972_015276 [Carpinus fangiana]
MARKGNQQKNGLDHHALNHKRRGSASGGNPTNTKGRGKACEAKVFPGEELPKSNQPSKSGETVSKINYALDENQSEKKYENLSGTEKQGMDAMRSPEQPMSSGSVLGDCIGNMETSTEQENGMLHGTNQGGKHTKSSLAFSLNGLNIRNVMENVEFSDNLVVRSVRASALSVLKAAREWLDRQRPLLVTLTTKILNARDYARMKVEQAYPIVLKWLMHFGSIMLLISMVWLDCTLRGIDSFLRMGTTSFFSVIWFSIFSVIAMVGMLKFLIVLLLDNSACHLPWSDVLIYFLKNNINQHRRPNSRFPEQTAGMQGQTGFFNGDTEHASTSETGPGLSADRGPGVPSTSGSDSELTSEEEVAMLVHPDKNMGNEKAAEAFKKLQNAYEVLLDTLKRKAYDDELRREELLNLFRRFQSTSQKVCMYILPPFFSAVCFVSIGCGGPVSHSLPASYLFFGTHFSWESNSIPGVYNSPLGISLLKDCKDFHQAKDGDGWVEQSSQPFFFGLLQKVDAPFAYVCADSRIYDATEWYICQGMRCPANTHKPTFHVNTSVTSKPNSGKGTSSGQRGGRMPASNMEESMTEEEFFEWLQNAMQSGMFDNVSGSTSTESPSGRSGNGTKSSGSNGGGSANKRKKKGKKQW